MKGCRFRSLQLTKHALHVLKMLMQLATELSVKAVMGVLLAAAVWAIFGQIDGLMSEVCASQAQEGSTGGRAAICKRLQPQGPSAKLP